MTRVSRLPVKTSCLRNSALLLAILTVFAAFCSTQAENPQEDRIARLLQQGALLGSFDHVTITGTMTIHEKGQEKTRELQISFEKAKTTTRCLVSIKSPASLANLKFLAITDPEGEKTWVKTSRGTKRLPSGKSEALFGSDFMSTDFTSPDLANLKTTLSEDKANGSITVEIRDKSNLLLQSRRYSAASGILEEAIYYTPGGSQERKFILEKTSEKEGKTYPLAIRMEGSDGNFTRFDISRFDTQATPNAGLFNPGSL